MQEEEDDFILLVKFQFHFHTQILKGRFEIWFWDDNKSDWLEISDDDNFYPDLFNVLKSDGYTLIYSYIQSIIVLLSNFNDWTKML